MIVAVPADAPVTTPAPLTLAVALLLQVPPGLPSDSGAAVPAHKADAPVIGAGAGFTVTVVNVVHPLPSE